MAAVAAGRQCPHDGTLVTCVGQDTDEVLVGTCPVDGTVVEVTNAQRIALEPTPPVEAVSPEHVAELAAANARIAELEAELAAARAALAEPKNDLPQGAAGG